MFSYNESDFVLERRLKELDAGLHKNYTNAVFGLQRFLSKYKLLMPDYTDHTELHAMNVIDLCGRVMGSAAEKMCADEIYVLLMACYFHDTGMGISREDYLEFSKQLGLDALYVGTAEKDITRAIREWHHEFSGLFIRKYAPFFEIPSEGHLWAIIQTARGHRKTDLLDVKEYPVSFAVPDGNVLCLPYLAAVIRLADEIDVTAARNSSLLYDLEDVASEISRIEFRKHSAVLDLTVSEKAFTLVADSSDSDILGSVRTMARKILEVLEQCRAAVNGRTAYMITQDTIRVEELY